MNEGSILLPFEVLYSTVYQTGLMVKVSLGFRNTVESDCSTSIVLVSGALRSTLNVQQSLLDGYRPLRQ